MEASGGTGALRLARAAVVATIVLLTAGGAHVAAGGRSPRPSCSPCSRH
ncbi:hypothetical protein [Paraoerskovia sediminicola]|nr:hypothetical protein [Paraoerskovia sediminicola]